MIIAKLLVVEREPDSSRTNDILHLRVLLTDR